MANKPEFRLFAAFGSVSAACLAIVMGTGAPAGASPLAQTGVCPDVATLSGGNTSDCNLLITFGAGGAISTTGPGGNYDYSEDSVIGVVNNSGSVLNAFNVSSTDQIFGFDGDGINGYALIVNNAMDTTGYGGPLAWFSNINATMTAGTVNFIGGLANGATTYFSLEYGIDLARLPKITPSDVPLPAGGMLLLTAFAGLGFAARRKKNANSA